MTWTVPIGDFRDKLALYLEKVELGDSLIIRDEKRDKNIGDLSPKNQFNTTNFMKAVDSVFGLVSAKNHPEWATMAKTEKWLRKIRLANQRRFDANS